MQKGCKMGMQIISSRCDENTLEDAFIIVSEIEVKDDRGQSSFYTLADLHGEPAFYHSEHSLLDDLLEDERSEAFDGELKSCDMGISDYEEVFEMGASQIKEILRYLVFLVRGDADEVDDLISNARGKDINAIEVPCSDLEEERNWT